MSNKARIYLAGPISGLSYTEATFWRQYTCHLLDDRGLQGLNPMRAKEYLSSDRCLAKQFDSVHPLSSNRGIVTRDRHDCTKSDMIFMNLLGALDVSIGSMVEVGWANASNIPIVLVMEAEGNVHEHAFLHDIPAFRVETLEEAVDIAAAFFSL